MKFYDETYVGHVTIGARRSINPRARSLAFAHTNHLNKIKSPNGII